MKCKFFPMNYALNFSRRLQNSKQLKMPVKEYMKELYNISIRFGYNDESSESIARYVNSLSYVIKYEFNVLNFHSVVEAYQADLRIEERLLRKQYNVTTTPGYGRGKHK